jgi:hypothetical protein
MDRAPSKARENDGSSPTRFAVGRETHPPTGDPGLAPPPSLNGFRYPSEAGVIGSP